MWLVRIVPCACADGSGMNFEPVPIIAEATPHCKQLLWLQLSALKRHYRTINRYDKEQTLPLTSLEARWLAPVPAQLASQNVRCFRTDRLTMCL